MEVTGAEHDRAEARDLVRGERSPSRQPHFERFARPVVSAVQTCRQRRGIVRDHAIIRTKQCGECASRAMFDVSGMVDDKQSRIVRALNRQRGRAHRYDLPCVAEWRNSCNADAIASANSYAASAGRFNVAGSSPGAASACNGVSMSPGSRDSIRMRWGASSTLQMRDIWRSAALLAP